MLRFALLCVLAVVCLGWYVQQPASALPTSDTQSLNSTHEAANDTDYESGDQQLELMEEEEEEERNSCPGCCERRHGCTAVLRGVDHMQALGFSRNDMHDWSSCTLPHFPQAK